MYIKVKHFRLYLIMFINDFDSPCNFFRTIKHCYSNVTSMYKFRRLKSKNYALKTIVSLSLCVRFVLPIRRVLMSLN